MESFENDASTSLHQTYQRLFEDLIKGPIDITFSGSTAVTCFINKKTIYTANSGDSRAFIGKEIGKERWEVEDLSNDHKPSYKNEAQRIVERGGRVEPYITPEGDFCGPERVWLKDDVIPGLAMTRSLGDLVAASVGVTWEPGKIID